jgi:drug/metabolite transporter (DMT)-like permease
MTVVEVAERKARWRALGYLFLAALTCAVMIVVRAGRGTDFTQGLWLGLLLGCALSLLPIKRWLRPNSAVGRLLDDEGTRENRRLSCTIGFWAAVGVALLFQALAHFNQAIGAEEVGQLVATAGILCAITVFAILELLAAR